MRTGRRHPTVLPSSHPSQAELELLEHEALAPDQEAGVRAHLAACEPCTKALSAIRAADFAVTAGLVLEPEAPSPEAGPAFSWPSPAELRAGLGRACDPGSRALPIAAIATLVGVLVPALWLATHPAFAG